MIRWFALALTGLLVLTACGEDSPTRHNEFAKLTAITISAPASLTTLAPGTSVQLEAEGIFDNGEFSRSITDECTWQPSEHLELVEGTRSRFRARVPRVEGTATVTATKNGILETFQIAVSNATISSIDITPKAQSQTTGLSQQFTATGTFVENSATSVQDITFDAIWTSSDTAVATIGERTGLAATHTAGSTTITAAFGGQESATTLTVTDPVLQSITVTPTSVTIAPTTTQAFTVNGNFDNGTILPVTTGVAWSSTSLGVATIDSTTGVATGVAPGLTTITGKVGSLSATAQLTVATPIRIDISQPVETIRVNTTPFELTATAVFSDTRTQNVTSFATWSPTATTGAASVSNSAGTKGRVTVHRIGDVTIQATLDGVTGNRPITVINGG